MFSIKRMFVLLVLLVISVQFTAPIFGQEDEVTVVIHTPTAFNTLNAKLVAGPSNAYSNLMNGVHEPLLYLNPDGEFEPWLATDWSISDDGLAVVLTLREGVTFHDGTEFNADAAIWNIEASLDPEIGGGSFSELQNVASVEKLGDYEIQINMASPDANILLALSDQPSFMVSPTAYESLGEDEYASNPVGTGPYMVDSWEPGVGLTTVKYDNYWGEHSGIDRFEWRVILDLSAAALNYQSGEVDVMYPGPITELPLLENIGTTEVEIISIGYAMLNLNHRIAPFNNVHNRRALRHGIDIDAIINLVYEGLAEPGKGFIASSNYAYNPDIGTAEYDLDAARAELEAAGNPDGFEFTVTVVAQPYRVQTLEIMQATLAEVGIEMNIQANERARHISLLREDPQDLNAAFVQQLFPTPDLNPFNASVSCDAGFIFSGYCNEEWQEMFESMPGIFDREERIQMVQELDRIAAVEEVVSIVYVYPGQPLVYRADRVQNVQINQFGLLDWTRIQLAGE